MSLAQNTGSGMPAPASSELLVTAGNISLDDTINPAGRVSAAPGGDALYSAVGAAIWRHPVAIVSRVGSDYPADFMTHAAGLGIGIDMIRTLPGPTVHYRITNAESGERRYEHVTSARRLHELSPQGPDLDTIHRAGWLHVAAMPIDVQDAVISRCRAERVPYSLDPHDEYIVGHEKRLGELIKDSIFMPSRLELELLYPDLSAEPTPQVMARVAANRLLAMGARAVAIKLGAHGAFVADPSHQAAVPSVPTPAVDSTGAGDAFCGGFLAGYLKTSSLLLGAVCGSISAAQIIKGSGALHSELPTPDTLRRQTEYLLGKLGAAADSSTLLEARFPWIAA
jgi:sugar/nucleoside kinase (ribokinase family)